MVYSVPQFMEFLRKIVETLVKKILNSIFIHLPRIIT